MADDMLSGDGSEADFLNSYGQSYEDNQSAFDVADNGGVTSTGSTTSVSTPNWMNSLSGLFGLASQGAGVVNQLTGKTTAPAATVAAPAAGSAASSLVAKVPGGNTTLMIVGGVVAIVLALLFFRKR